MAKRSRFPAPEQRRRPKAGQQGGPGGAEPPGTIIQNYNYITSVFCNLKNLNNLNLNCLNRSSWLAGRFRLLRLLRW